MKWRSHSSAARTSLERAHGCITPRTSAFCCCDLCRRAGRGPVRLRVRPGCVLDLALHPHALADRYADHRVRPDRAGLFGLETSPRAGLEKARACRARGRTGVPVGVSILTWANPAHVRIGVGVFLVLYSLYALFRPAIAPVKAGGAVADAGVGFLNGVLGGITGLAGILVTVWCGLRGWPKDQQRTVFQPVAVAIFLMSALWIGAKGAITADIIKLFLIGLPALFAGTWLGLKLFGRLNEAAFRKVVLVLLLASGVVLIV